MKRWITYAAISGFLLAGGVRGTCHERVRRPVGRFIDFYVAAQEAQKPPSLLERIAMALAIAAAEPQAEETEAEACNSGV